MYTQPEEHCSRAMALMDNGDFHGALSEAHKAVTRSNKVAAGYRCRGIVHVMREGLHLAIDDFSSALEWEPEHAPTLDNRGLSFARLGRYEEAYSDFSAAIEIEPTYSRAFRHRAMASWNFGRNDQAVADEEISRMLLED